LKSPTLSFAFGLNVRIRLLDFGRDAEHSFGFVHELIRDDFDFDHVVVGFLYHFHVGWNLVVGELRKGAG
jgi:hypothetical protein